MSEIETSWRRIEHALALLEPPVNGRLPPGASAAALAELEKHIPVPLPRELRESLACHDGTGSVELDELPPLLSMAGIIEAYERLSKGIEGCDGPVPFKAEWIPLEAYGGVWILLDASREDAASPLLCASVGEAEASESEDTLTVLLHQAADKLEAMTSPQEQPADAPPWSRRFIEELIAAGDLVLLADADLSLLADQVDNVASRNHGGKLAMGEALLEALVNAPEVDEVFADPEGIIRALTQVLSAQTPRDSA